MATGLREPQAPAGLRKSRPASSAPEGALLCQAFGLDPLGTIASGALLAAVPAAQVDAIRACAEVGIACYCIGTAVAEATEIVLQTGTQTRPLPTFTRDEILTIFERSQRLSTCAAHSRSGFTERVSQRVGWLDAPAHRPVPS